MSLVTMERLSFMKTLSFLLASLSLVACLKAQQFDDPVTIPVSYYGMGVMGSGPAYFSFGTELGAVTAGSVSSGNPGSTFYSSPATAYVTPNKDYSLTVTASGSTLVTVMTFLPTNGCQVYINQNPSRMYGPGRAYTVTVRFEVIDSVTKNLIGKRGGECSSFADDKPLWCIGLGSDRNGQFVGAIGFRKNAITSDLYTPAALICSSVCDVSITRDSNGYITQVQSLDVVLKVSSYVANGTSYTIKACQSATPTIPFITYTISKYSDSYGTGIRIDKAEAASSDGTSTGSTWTTVLQQTSTGWRKYGWQQSFSNTNNAIVTTVSGSSSTINYGLVDNSGHYLTQTKIYTTVNGQTELQSSTWGSANPTTYTYYNSSSNGGWTAAVKSITDPTGNWTAYDYYDGTNNSNAGSINHIYRPSLDSPGAWTIDSTQGYVETYTYAANYDGSTTAPAMKIVTVNGTTVGKTTWTYNWSANVVNSHTIAQVIENDYSASSAFLTTTKLSYLPNDANYLLQGRPHSVIRPDGTKDAYAYYFGTWNSSTNTFTPNSTGFDRYILAFHGQNAAGLGSGSGATAVSSWTVGSTSLTLDTIYLVQNLSTVTETVIDGNGHVVFSGENIYNGSGIERIAATASTFNGNNQLTKQKDLIRSVAGATNGEVAVNFTYNAGLLLSKIDVDGTEQTWHCDNYLRNDTIVTGATGSGSYPAKTQNFAYYSSNLKYTAQECSCSDAETTYYYDSAGRISLKTEPFPGSGNPLTTGYSYTTSVQTTVSLPTNATLTTDYYVDGRVKDQVGTGHIDTRFSYSVNSSSQIVKTTQHGTTTANGWVEETFDWLGRKVLERTPQWGWTSGSSAVLRKAYTFNSSGQLSSVATQDESHSNGRVLPDHLYIYGNLGRCTAEGDDLGNNGSLDLSTTDRIVLHNLWYFKDTSVYNGWIRADQDQVYRDSSNLTTVSEKHTRLTRFNNGAMLSGGTARVLADVTTIDSSNRSVSDLDWADATALSKTHQHSESIDTSNAAYTYWQNGYLQSEQSMSGVTKTYTYNGQGKLSTVLEDTTNTSITYYYYDGTKYISRTVATTGVSLGQPTTATTNYSYSWNGTNLSNTVAVTDAASNVAYTEYDALGRPWRGWGTATLPWLNTFDAYGRRTGLSTWRVGSFTGSSWPNPSAGDTTSWTPDPATGLVTTKTFANNTQISYTYNARGQPLVRTWARGKTTTYGYYDSAGSQTGELHTITYIDGTPTVTLSYGRAGNLTSVTDAAGTRTIAPRSDLKPGTETYDSGFYNSRTLTYNYDTNGRPTGYSFNGDVTAGTALAYDPVTGRIGSITGTRDSTIVAFNLGYATGTDWVNSVTCGSYARSLPLVSCNDVLSEVKTTWGSSTLGDFSAQYTDSRGWRNNTTANTSAWTSALSLSGALSSTYSFDGAGELTGSAATVNGNASSSRSFNWTFDLAGNRQNETGGSGTTMYSMTDNSSNKAYGALNQYSAITGGLPEGNLTYDADGNLTHDAKWTYTYDGENRIKSMTTSGQTLSFTYDYQGRRIRKLVTGTNASDTKYVWCGWTLAAEVATSSNAVGRTYVFGPDFSDAHGAAGGAGALLAQLDSTGATYAMPDALGNIVGYINSSGFIVAAAEYTAFGRMINSAGTPAHYPFGFAGQYTDAESGFCYYGLRYYNPKHGRFVNRDPIEEQGGANLYAFCGNDGVNIWDILGAGCHPESYKTVCHWIRTIDGYAWQCVPTNEPVGWVCDPDPPTVNNPNPPPGSPTGPGGDRGTNGNSGSNGSEQKAGDSNNPQADPKKEPPKDPQRKKECDDARDLYATAKNNVEFYSEALQNKMPLSAIVRAEGQAAQRSGMVLGYAGFSFFGIPIIGGATDEFKARYSQGLVDVVNSVELDNDNTTFRYKMFGVGMLMGAIQPDSSLDQGAGMGLAVGEMYAHAAFAQKLEDFIAKCKADGY